MDKALVREAMELASRLSRRERRMKHLLPLNAPRLLLADSEELLYRVRANWVRWWEEHGEAIKPLNQESLMAFAELKEAEGLAETVATHERRGRVLHLIEEEADLHGIALDSEMFYLEKASTKSCYESDRADWEVVSSSFSAEAKATMLQRAREKVAREDVEHHTLMDLVQHYAREDPFKP